MRARTSASVGQGAGASQESVHREDCAAAGGVATRAAKTAARGATRRGVNDEEDTAAREDNGPVGARGGRRASAHPTTAISSHRGLRPCCQAGDVFTSNAR